MKLRHVFFAMLATGLFAACNNDDITVDNTDNGDGVEAFITVKVALPSSTSPGTRDGQGKPNDDFAAGSSDEYEVRDLTIVVFNSEEDGAIAQVVQPASVTKWSEVGQTANITISSPDFLGGKDAIEVGTAPDRYVLVIANSNGQLTPAVGQTYGAIKKALTGKSKIDFMGEGKGFFMSNSPIVKDGKVQTLAPCKPQLTATAAQSDGNYAIVHLERILGKVEVEPNFGEGKGWTYTVPTHTPATLADGDIITFTNWGLDVTNRSTYPVRQVVDEWIGYANGDAGTTSDATAKAAYPNNRFIGEDKNPQRIYWAVDPNYATEEHSATQTTDFDMLTSLPNDLTKKTIDYCLENTFDIANQNQDRTTRIVMQANYTHKGWVADDSKDFYRIAGIIYSQEVLFADLAIKFGISGIKSIVVNSQTEPLSAKDATITSITYNTGVGEDVTISSNDKTPNAAFATYPKVDYYKEGVCFYVARIKHFGDKLTPWAYGADYNAKDHLGRYGVVRNNWYVLTIKAVDKGPGEPTIPTTPPGIDDEMTYYIDAQIRILSWAKRTQDVEW